MLRPFRARVAVVVALAFAAAGCEIVADFDRTKVDAKDAFGDGGLVDGDATTIDTGTLVDAGHDAAGDASDGGLLDGDATVAETGAGDDGGDAGDAGADTSIDGDVGDTNAPDVNVADTNAPDTSADDASDDGAAE